MRVRTHLVLLVVGALVPVVVFSVLMVFRDAAHQAAVVEDDLVDRARGLSLALDREIESSITALESLATSEHLDSDDVGAFYRQSERVSGTHPFWVTVALIDRSGRHVLSLLRPSSTPLLVTPVPETIEQIVRTGRPWVSGLHQAPISGRSVLTIGVPVVRQGTIRYVVTAAVGLNAVAEIVAGQHLPLDWIVTVLDPGHVVVARTPEREGVVGAVTRAPWATKIAAPEGSFPTKTLDDTAAYLAYVRSPRFGWTVALAVPTSTVTGNFSPLWTTGGGGVVLILLGMLFALLLGRRIGAGFTALTSAAAALGRNEPAAFARSTISEVNTVARAIDEAAATRARAEAALRDSEAQYRRIVETAGEGIWMIDQTGRVTYANECLATMLGWTVAEMMACPLGDFMASESRPVLCERPGPMRRGEVIREELRLRRKDGSTLWTIVATTCVVGPDGQRIGVLGMVLDVTERRRAENAAWALEEIASEIAGSRDLPRVADRIVSVVLRTLHAQRVTLFELDPSSGDLACVATVGRIAGEQWVGRTLGRGVGVVGRALAYGRPVWFADLSADDPTLRHPAWVVELLGDGRYSSMAAPLTVKGETIGVLGLAAEAGREPTADDLDLLSALADQAAVALQNSRLYRDQELRARRLSVLSRLNQLISSSLDADVTLGAIANAAAELMESVYAAIWIVDEARAAVERRVATTHPYPLQRQRFGEGLTGWAAQHRIIVNVADGAGDPRTLRPDWFEAVGVRSFLALPIIHEASLLGVLTLARVQPYVLEQGTREMLDSFVAQSAVAIRNAQLFEEAQRRRHQAEMLAVLARTIGATLDLDAVLQQAVEVARDLLSSDRANIALRDRDTSVMVMRYGAPKRLGRAFEGLRIEEGKGLGGLAWTLGRPVRTDDYAADPRLTHDYDTVVQAVGLVAVLAVPIVIADAVEGLLYVNNMAPRPFTEHDEIVLTDLALHAAIAIQNARLFERVQSAGDRLAALSRRLLEVQEAERRYLARELHDEIGQLLTGLTLILERSKRLPGESSLVCVGEAQALTTELLARVRNLSLDLRPAVLDDLGLLPALLWHFERYTASTGVRVAFKQRGLDGQRFAPEIETAGYRIVQEALTNVARHSGAPEATVIIAAADGWLRIEIEDHGVGFDPEAVLNDARSSGLSGLRERARLSSGRVTVTSACGVGTCLTVELPSDGAPERTPR